MVKNVLGRSMPIVSNSFDCGSFRSYNREDTVTLEGKIGSPVVRATRFVSSDVIKDDDLVEMPISEEYSLDGLLASGAPLREVDCEHLLDSSDLLDLKNQGVTGSLFSTLQEYVENKSKKQVVENFSSDASPAAAAADELNNSHIEEPNK